MSNHLRRLITTLYDKRIRIDLTASRTPVLGRWKRLDESLALRKADMTNEDHCGTCDKMRYDYVKKGNKN